MPTKYYSSMFTKANIEAAENRGFIDAAAEVVLVHREPISEDEWKSLDEISEEGTKVSRNPLCIYFEDGRIRSGIMIADEPQIEAILEAYGVRSHEELLGKPLVAHREKVVPPGKEPFAGYTLAISRPE